MPEEIVAALARGATVLTGNQRAARTLRIAVERQNRAAGRSSWTPPPLLAWDTWTSGLWHRRLVEGAATQMLLNRAQEQALWRAIVEEDSSIATLRSPETLAGLAAEAWATLAQYRGLGRLRGSATNSDTEAFERWAAIFEERCRTRGYLPQARLEGALRAAILGKTLDFAPEAEFLLTGFDRILPSQSALLDAMREAGVKASFAATGTPTHERTLAAAEDEASELRAAAEWARDRLIQHPEAGIAIIVPGLRDQRPAIDRVFRQILAPASQSIAAAPDSLPYEFSLGIPLSASPPLSAALDLLTWAGAPLDLEQVSRLLLSPHFAGGAERNDRAEFDAFDLRRARLLRPEISLDWMVTQVEQSDRRSRLSALLAALRNMRTVVERSFGSRERQTCGEWAEAIRELLSAVGWTAAPGLDSIEFQAREKWESALDEFSTLDFDGSRVAWPRALQTLSGIARETIFAPASRQAPVQIMGPEESAGSTFDALWFLRAGDLAWPAPIYGSPLLGWPLRKELGIPGSDAAAGLAQARRTAQRIAASTGNAVFSYARRTSDGNQRPSPALSQLALEERPANPCPEPPSPLIALEAVEDDARIQPLPDATIEGGTGILKAQAACAFHAFAEHRLFATELDRRDPGMNPRERGIAVHSVLEHFWAEVKSQAKLLALTASERDEAVNRSIDASLARTASIASSPWDRAYLDTQRTRLLTLCREWLDMEAARPIAFEVAEREAAKKVSIGPLRLDLRVDRIDRTDHGSVLIDYKTGAAAPSAWLTERPEEPQLPLYAVLAEDLRLHAIALGNVRPGKDMALAGYEDAKGTLTKPARNQPENLETQLEQWYEVLTGLATRFAEGDTRVSPRKYPITCQYCAHRLICRLDAVALELDDDDAPEDAHG